MTSVADFRSRFAAAMATITRQSPGTRGLRRQHPDVYQLWDLSTVTSWRASSGPPPASASPCSRTRPPPARPTSTPGAGGQRNIDFNAQLAQVCALYAQCRFDGGAAFNTALRRGDVSGDYFHPSVAGQAKLASVSWAAGYTLETTPRPRTRRRPRRSLTAASGWPAAFNDTSTDTDGIIAGARSGPSVTVTMIPSCESDTGRTPAPERTSVS